jgi:hypothetical protein
MRAVAILAMLRPRRASMRLRSRAILVVSGWRWMASTARPSHEFAALLGDVSAPHDGVGFAVGGGQTGPRAQVRGVGETRDVADLGDEHRRQHRTHAGQLLDRLIATVSRQPLGDHRGEARINCGDVAHNHIAS